MRTPSLDMIIDDARHQSNLLEGFVILANDTIIVSVSYMICTILYILLAL